MIEQFWQDLRATSGLEAVAVALGITYVLLIVRRNRWGWVAGACSSVIYVWLSARAGLPMQSALQAYYVAMAFYGWYSWTRNAATEGGRVHSWSWRFHLPAAVTIVIISLLSARWLAAETQAAWPKLDSLSTGISLLATWLVARSVLQNWFYWMVADAIAAFLFLQQSHPFTAGLFIAYLLIAVSGYRTWQRRFRLQTR